jgi:hypothetical protein
MKKVTNFLKAFALVTALLATSFLTGCIKETPLEKETTLTIQLDYIGGGGYYNDNIAAVPSGLIIGSNGPFTIDKDQTYTLEYKADANFPVITKSWKPTSGAWKIHCYKSGNTAYLQVLPGN